MKEESENNASVSRPPRKMAVAPLQHPVFALSGRNINIEEQTDMLQKSSCCEIDEYSNEISTPLPVGVKVLSDLGSDENVVFCAKEKNHYKNKNNGAVFTEIHESCSAKVGRGLVRSATYRDKSCTEKYDESNKECQNKSSEVLDKDLFAWREKVKGCVSFPSLPNKFRPLHRSVGSCSGRFREENAVWTEMDHCTGKENVKFYLPEQKPDYLINPNRVVTTYPGRTALYYRSSLKLENVVRNNLLQDKSSRRMVDSDECLKSSRPMVDSDECLKSRRRMVDNDECLKSRRRMIDSDECLKSSSLQQEVSPFHRELSKESCHGVGDENSSLNHVRQPFFKQNSEPPENVSELKYFSETKSPLQSNKSTTCSSDLSDYDILKDIITHLRLPTRRASTMAWKAKYVDNSPGNGWFLSSSDPCSDDGPLTPERKNNIQKSLEILKLELMSLQRQDQELANQFLTIRQTLNNLRWNAQCHSHEQLLEEVEDDIEDLRDLSRVVDTPADLFSSTSFLRHFGLTRMNITTRRFSTC
ncbi:protein FAM167B [Biomphalaria pfeifferi]|uniref:Protein FAM167B n=1 Tax=Biomphalaria pfeifferi TaxID=112525 RepID=A0AAD8B7Z3_BIOPF|nr:protein FAM167B [Biomphalaria pfeifferi]